MKNFIALSIFLSMTMLFSSCGPTVVYNAAQDLGDNWPYEQEMDFTFDIADVDTKYDLMLEVKHSPEFGYQNFYTNVTTTFPDGKVVVDPLSIELSSKMGSWLSDCSKEECNLKLLLRNDIKFQQVGKYTLSFQQDTREDKLEGISALALSLLLVE